MPLLQAPSSATLSFHHLSSQPKAGNFPCCLPHSLYRYIYAFVCTDLMSCCCCFHFSGLHVAENCCLLCNSPFPSQRHFRPLSVPSTHSVLTPKAASVKGKFLISPRKFFCYFKQTQFLEFVIFSHMI